MWAGTQSQIQQIDFSKGIDGVSNVSDIPDGYAIDMVNLDLSKPGRGRKRSGYNLWGCDLPVRTRNITASALGRSMTLDAIPLLTITFNLYANTGQNLSDYGRAEILQTDDSASTLYAVIDTGILAHPFTLSVDTLFEFTDYLGNKRFVCPVAVFDNNTVIFPVSVLSWLANPLPVTSDLAPVVTQARICSGFSFNAIRETDIDTMEVSSTAPGTIILSISKDEVREKLPAGTQIYFETIFYRQDLANPGGRVGLHGHVDSVSGEEVTIVTNDSSLLVVGNYDLTYFAMRYASGKSYWYKSENKSFINSGPLYSGVTNYTRITGTNRIEFSTFQDFDPAIPLASYDEVGFIYGTGIDAGYLNFVSKYYDTETDRERIITGYDGNVFKEQDYPFLVLPIIASLRYAGASTTIPINPSTKTFQIPLTEAHKIYLAGDIVSLTYAVDTAGNLVTEQYKVYSVGTNIITLESNGDQILVMRRGTKFSLTRTSNKVYVDGSALTMPLCAGMTLQLTTVNSQERWHTIKEVSIDVSSPELGDKFIILDDAVEWSTDGEIYLLPYFQPIFQPSTYLPLNPAYVNLSKIQMSAAPVDRSVFIATGLNGIWRFNGSEVVSMRIPLPPSGLVRNVPGGGGFLRVDRGSDGSLSLGRTYEFKVTYSYSELVNGVYKEYESGLNPVGSYVIDSEASDNGRGGSKLVELQIPTIPEGIGLPARNMRINIYRKLDGDAPGQIIDQVHLKELQLANNPDTPYLAALVGFEAPLTFNAAERKKLYTDLGRPEDTEIARPVDDPPLASVLVTHENRLFAMNGYQQPYVKFVCSSVFDLTDNSFLAHAMLSLVPVFLTDKTYRFVTCPCQMTTVSSSQGGGALGRKFQLFQVPYYEINKVSLVDNSNLFVLTGFVVTDGLKYLLRFSRGQKEAKAVSLDNPYYDDFGFERQVFTGTSTANTVSAKKKWTRKDSVGAVVTPSESFYVFALERELTTISSTNGLQIGSVDESGSLTTPVFTLKISEAALSIALNSYIILYNLGTLGNVKDGDGKILSFDADLIFEIVDRTNSSSVSTYSLSPVRRNRSVAGAGEWEGMSLTAGYPVSNAAGGIVHGNVSIYLLTAATERAVTGFTLSPTIFSMEFAAGGVGSPPPLPVTPGTAYQIQGLPLALPEPVGLNYNGRFELESVGVGPVYNFRLPGLPADSFGNLGVDMAAFTPKGRVNAASSQIIAGVGYLDIYVQSAVLTVGVRSGQYVYIICRGNNPSNYSLGLTGWHKILSVYNGVVWSNNLAIGETLQAVRIAYTASLDYDLITGLAYTRLLFADATTDTEIVVPVPVPYKRGVADDDITGEAYGPVDGYTALEKVIRRFCHAINSTINATGFAYWGGNAYGRIDGEIPVNGFIFYPHLYPVNRYAHSFDSVNLNTLDIESRWELRGEEEIWSVEGSDSYEAIGVTNPLEVLTAKEYYPAKYWYTDAPTISSRTFTRAFRVLSNKEVASEDGEELVTGVSYQTYLLLLKRNSIWRLRFAGGIEPVVERTQSVVGCDGKKSAVATDRGVFFLHSSGVYISDGGETRPIVQVKRHFEDYCIQNRDLFSFTASHHNPLTKTVTIGVPFGSKVGGATESVDGQFVFNYSLQEVTLHSVQQGWSRNTNIPATDWVRILDGDFFASSEGRVYRIRPETESSRYRDYGAAIEGTLQTKFIGGEPEIQPKFFKSCFFQFGTETSSNMSVRVAWDYLKDSQLLQIVPIDADGFGKAPFGTSYFGAQKWVINERRTMRPTRTPQVSFVVENKELDVAGEVYGIFIEFDRGSTKLIPQSEKL